MSNTPPKPTPHDDKKKPMTAASSQQPDSPHHPEDIDEEADKKIDDLQQREGQGGEIAGGSPGDEPNPKKPDA